MHTYVHTYVHLFYNIALHFIAFFFGFILFRKIRINIYHNKNISVAKTIHLVVVLFIFISLTTFRHFRYPNLYEVRLIPTKKDIAFVEYLDEGSATVAKDALHNYKLDGENKIKVCPMSADY